MNDGIVLIKKEKGMTSRQVDNHLGHLFATKKVGHLGTLDPFAEGLLVIGINKGTKFLTYLDDSRKKYVATLILGKKTTTGDWEGETLLTKEIPFLNEEIIQKALDSFLGEGEQIPPMFSAIKMDGVPLYKKAYQGVEIERKPRKIHIHSIHLLSYREGEIVFECEVSRGTYIRTLGEDIAQKLGTVGYLSSLNRTHLGIFDVKDAILLEEANENSLLDPSPYLPFPSFEVSEEEDFADIMNGRMVYVGKDLGERIVMKKEGKALAIYVKVQDTLTYKPERGLF